MEDSLRGQVFVEFKIDLVRQSEIAMETTTGDARLVTRAHPRSIRPTSRPLDRRNGRMDRRAESNRHAVTDSRARNGLEERRRGPRRLLEIRRPRWQRLAVAGLSALLGVLAGDLVSGATSHAPLIATKVESATRLADEGKVSIRLLELRDEAEQLTVSAILLDERLRTRWLMMLPDIEGVAAEPRAPSIARDEARATLLALRRAGVESIPHGGFEDG